MPDVELHNLDEAWPVWQRWRAGGKRLSIAQIIAEPEPLTSDVYAIEFAYQSRKQK
jgi:hypothetical protein